MNVPVCAEFLEKRCPMSNTCVAQETDQVYVILCRTCGSKNIWPKDREEKHAKYQAFLKQQHDNYQQAEAMKRAPAYSISSRGRKS